MYVAAVFSPIATRTGRTQHEPRAGPCRGVLLEQEIHERRPAANDELGEAAYAWARAVVATTSASVVPRSLRIPASARTATACRERPGAEAGNGMA